MDTRWATLESTGGKSVLRFERRLAHRPEKVWDAITDPAELAHWFPARVSFHAGLTPGGEIRFRFEGEDTETTGEVIEVDRPKLFVLRWQDEVLRFELLPDGDGCRLLFTHLISDTMGGALAAGHSAAGWDTCLAGLAARLEGRSFTPPEMFGRVEAYHERFGLNRGAVVATGDGYLVRFERDLVWRPAEAVWSALTGDGEAPAVGTAPPRQATNPRVTAGQVTAAEPPHLLEYDWLHDGAPAGRVRWEITTDPKRSHRVRLTQTVPAGLKGVRASALAGWQVHLELVFASLIGGEQRSWPADRAEQLEKQYAADLF